MFMFTFNIHAPQRSFTFAKCKCLVNKQFKYRSLGEMVAMARATNQPLLQTRNGVYTGELVIPREKFDKVNVRNNMMDSYDVAENKLKEANEAIEKENSAQRLAEARAKIIAEHEASKAEK